MVLQHHAENPGAYSFLRAKETRKITEDKLLPVGEKSGIEMEQLVRGFFIDLNKKVGPGFIGGAHVESAAFQNRLLRACYKNPHREAFLSRFRQEISAQLSQAQAKKSMKISAEKAGEAYRTHESGVVYMLDTVLPAVEQRFLEERGKEKALQHFVGINNRIDAVHGIDLVEIVFIPKSDAITIRDTRFIQAKRQQLNVGEREKIFHEHAEYLKECVGKEALERENRRLAAQRMVGGAYGLEKRNDIEPVDRSDEDTLFAVISQYEKLFSALPKDPMLTQKEFVASLKEASIKPEVLAELVFLSKDERLKPIIPLLKEFYGKETTESALAWLRQQELSDADIDAVIGSNMISPVSVYDSAAYTSVLYHGLPVRVEEKKLFK